MPTEFYPHYDSDFALAIVKAYVLGKPEFVFHEQHFFTSDFMDNIRKDFEHDAFVLRINEDKL